MRQTKFLFLVLLVLSGCQKKQSSADDSQRLSERTIGTMASIAAAMHVDAERACEMVGTSEIPACAKNQGNLLAEREARVAASASMSHSKRFFDRCLSGFDVAYCNELMARAIQIERRKPASSEPIENLVNESR